MARVEINNKEDLERWLNRLPEEQGQRVTAAIACRAALRVLPVLYNEMLLKEESEKVKLKGLVLVFHVISSSWGISIGIVGRLIERNIVWSSDVIDIIVRAQYARRTVREIRRNPPFARMLMSLFIASSPAISISHAVSAARNTLKGNYADAVDAAYHAISYANRVNSEVIWRSVSEDANFINDGGKSQELMKQPLWLTATPEWTQQLWSSLKSRLLSREDEHWEVWTNWYDARLDPSKPIPCYNPPVPELERARVLLPEDLWEQGPAAVNAAIKRLIEEHECSKDEIDLSQWPAPWCFAVHEGRIAAQALEDKPENPQIAEELYQELREKVEELEELSRRTNALPVFFRKKVEKLRKTLGERLEDVKPGILLSQGNRISDICGGMKEFDEEVFIPRGAFELAAHGTFGWF